MSSLINLEKQFWNAAGDGEFYESYMADDGVCVLPVGVLDKSETIAAISQADPWDSFSIDDVVTTRVADGVTALSYRAEGERGDAPRYRAAVTTIYRDAGDGWKLLIHQQTPLAGG